VIYRQQLLTLCCRGCLQRLCIRRKRNGDPGRWHSLLWRRLPRDSVHKHKAAFRLTFLDVLKNRIQVVIETGGMGVAGSTNLINDGIGHGVASNRSSGVHMIGALNPFPLQTFPITGLIGALANADRSTSAN